MKMIGMARLTRDVELRYTNNGVPVANLNLAFNYGPKDNEGKQATQFVEASLWEKRAESLAQYLLKGQQVYVEVRDVHVETYNRNDGGMGAKLAGTVGDIEFGARPRNAEDHGGQQRQGGQGQQRQGGGQGYGQQRGYGGGQNQSPGQRARAAQNQAPQQKDAGGGGGATGFDDFEDSIPF